MSATVCLGRKGLHVFQSVCPDLANFRHFGETLKVFGNILRGYLVFGIIMSILWQIWSAIGQIFISVNGDRLKNNLAIWSRWFRVKIDGKERCRKRAY